MPENRRIFLTSSIVDTIKEVVKLFDKPVNGESLAFISTASEVEGGMRMWIYDDLALFDGLGFKSFSYTLTDKTEDQVRSDLKNVDVLFVAGGNAFYLLDKIHKSGFQNIAHEHVNAGKVYIGESSGTLAAGPDMAIAHRPEALEKVPNLTDFTGMGLVDFMVLPHWGSDLNKDFYLHHRMEHAYGMKNKIILVTDKQFVFVKGDWYRIVQAEN